MHSKAFVSYLLVHIFYHLESIYCLLGILIIFSHGRPIWVFSSTIPKNLALCTHLKMLLLIFMLFNQSSMLMFLVWKMLSRVLFRFAISLISSSHLSIRSIAIFSSSFSVYGDWLMMNMSLSSAYSLVLWLSGRKFGISFLCIIGIEAVQVWILVALHIWCSLHQILFHLRVYIVFCFLSSYGTTLVGCLSYHSVPVWRAIFHGLWYQKDIYLRWIILFLGCLWYFHVFPLWLGLWSSLFEIQIGTRTRYCIF